MGIVNCANEAFGWFPSEFDSAINKHFDPQYEDGIPAVVKRILSQSKETGKSTQKIAQELANQKSLELNPIFGHRSWEIIKYLVGKDEGKKEARWVEWLKENEPKA